MLKNSIGVRLRFCRYDPISEAQIIRVLRKYGFLNKVLFLKYKKLNFIFIKIMHYFIYNSMKCGILNMEMRWIILIAISSGICKTMAV
jgi:hypothetical protein